MTVLDLKKYFGFANKAELLKAINHREAGAGKSLSATFKFKEAMAEHGVEEGSYARVKLSNFYAWFRRGIWGFGMDPNRADTIAEFVGSRMAAAVSNPADDYESAPKVDLFADDKGAYGLVSLYVKNVKGSLDDVRDDLYEEAQCKKNPALISSKKAKEMRAAAKAEVERENLNLKETAKRLAEVEASIAKNSVPKQKGHARLVCSSDPAAVPIRLDPNNPKAIIVGGYLAKELKKSIALRGLLGDHDGNPGNYLIVTGADGRPHVAGIDYGHSFNDMIKSLADGKNPRAARGILNYFNHGSNYSKNKLNNFSGIIPSEDFAELLRESASVENVAKMQAAALSAMEEMKELRLKGVSEKRITDTIKTLCTRMGHPLSKNQLKTFSDTTRGFGEVMSLFVEDNAKEMQSVANLIEIQVKIDKALKSGMPVDVNAIESICSKDNWHLKDKTLTKDTIEWPKTDYDKNPQVCTVADYVALRAKQLKKAGELKMNDQEIKTSVAQFKQNAKTVDKDNKEAKEQRFNMNIEMIQAEVENAIKGNRSVDKKMITEIYKANLGGKNLKDKIDWPANDYNKKAKRCTIDKYIESHTPHKQKSWVSRLVSERSEVASVVKAR